MNLDNYLQLWTPPWALDLLDLSIWIFPEWIKLDVSKRELTIIPPKLFFYQCSLSPAWSTKSQEASYAILPPCLHMKFFMPVQFCYLSTVKSSWPESVLNISYLCCFNRLLIILPVSSVASLCIHSATMQPEWRIQNALGYTGSLRWDKNPRKLTAAAETP